MPGISTFKIVLNRNNRLNPRIPLVPAIFPVTTLAVADVHEVFDQFNAHNVFRHLVAELAFYPHAERCAIADKKIMIVKFIGENRLRVIGVFQINAFVILRTAIAHRIGADKHHVACVRQWANYFQQRA